MPMFPNGLNSLRDFLRATVAAVIFAPPSAYAAVTTNSAPATVLANPIADTFIVSSAVALAGSTEGSLTWVNYPFGTNPGSHNKNADGSGVGGNAAGRACSVLPYGVTDGEISANVTVFVSSSEGQASLIGRADTTVATGTYYEVRYSYGQYVSLHRVNAGTDTALGTASVTGTTNTFYPLKMRIVDVGDGTTSIRCFFNNVEVLSVIDSTPLTTTGWGLLGGRNVRYKNLSLGGWQLQTQFAYTPNVYDQSAANVIVSGLTATAPGATLSLANNDGGRFALVETTGFNEIAGYKQYNIVTTSTTTKIADGNSRSIQVTETPQANASYAAKTATLSLGVVAPLPTRTTRLASAGGIIPNAITNAGTGNPTAYQSQVHWYVGSDDMSQLQFVFDNWQLANGEITGLNTGLTISKASFHIPGAPIPLVPVTFSGNRSLLLANGDAAILSDPIYPAQFGLTVFPRGTMGWLRSAGSAPAVSGAVASIPSGRYVNSGYPTGCFMERGTATTNAQVDSTVNMTSQGGTTLAQSTGATAMVGKTVNTGKLAVFGLGDSIMDGLFDIPSTITVPYGHGWLPRAASDSPTSTTGGTASSLIAFMQGDHSGDSDWATSSGATTRISKHWAFCNVLIDAFDTNDIGTAGTGNFTTIHNNAVSTWNLVRAASSGIKVLRTTLQPRTNQYVTLASLTGDGTSVATATVPSGQPLPAVGATFPITISGATPTGYNGTFTGTVTSATTFTYPIASGLATTATGTILATDAGASQYFQVPVPGWTSGGLRDQLIAQYRTDLSNGVIDGIIDTLSATAAANDNTRWAGGNVVNTDTSQLFTHPYAAAGNGPIGATARTALLALTGLA